MSKEGINYKLFNCTFFLFIILILYKLNLLNTILNVSVLLLSSISISYIIYPIFKNINTKYNKTISIIIIYGSIVILLFFTIYSIIPNSNLINKIIDLFSNLLKFENIINTKYNLNIDLDKYIEKIISYMLTNSIFIIKNIFKLLTKTIFSIILSICILLNIDYIKLLVNKLKYKELLFNINNKLKYFLIANIKIVLIQLIEYTLAFLIIGHPNYLLLGILNSINSFIPYIGVLITNTIAITTSSVISRKLLILTAIISIIMPQIDSYVINPRIYKQTNKIPQTLYISSVIIGGTLFGFYGIAFAIPILITIIEVLKYKNIVKQ